MVSHMAYQDKPDNHLSLRADGPIWRLWMSISGLMPHGSIWVRSWSRPSGWAAHCTAELTHLRGDLRRRGSVWVKVARLRVLTRGADLR